MAGLGALLSTWSRGCTLALLLLTPLLTPQVARAACVDEDQPDPAVASLAAAATAAAKAAPLSPRSSSRRATWEPMNPAAPVSKIFMWVAAVPHGGQGPGHCLCCLNRPWVTNARLARCRGHR